MILTLEIIDRLKGKAIRLSSPYSEGQLLSVSPIGKISLEAPEADGVDQRWKLMPKGDGFEIISAKFGFKICHNQKNLIVSAINQGASDESACVWELTEEGEIFQQTPEGELYLWLAGGRLYVTNDGFLAEKWGVLEKLPSPVGNQYTKFMIAAILILLFMMWWK